jgi:hypothetical protein
MTTAFASMFRTHRHVQSPAERALRLLWSPAVLEVTDTGDWLITDEQIEEIGRVLGLTETPTPQPVTH